MILLKQCDIINCDIYLSSKFVVLGISRLSSQTFLTTKIAYIVLKIRGEKYTRGGDRFSIMEGVTFSRGPTAGTAAKAAKSLFILLVCFPDTIAVLYYIISD